jgi:uncharacterized damage-inducible protein DinB
MKSKLILICLIFTISGYAIAQKTSVLEAFQEKWNNSGDYLTAMAEMMPEDFFEFKPTPRQRSFKEQLLHIRDNMLWLSTTYISSEEIKPLENELPISKSETIALLHDAFLHVSEIIKNTSEENLSETVEFFAGPKSKLQILNLLQDHVTHHRGQLIVYLNLKNIEPPKYVGW